MELLLPKIDRVYVAARDSRASASDLFHHAAKLLWIQLGTQLVAPGGHGVAVGIAALQSKTRVFTWL
jgi:hypothetical protein